MIFDSHAHVDVEPAYGMFDTPEKLIRQMDAAGVSMAAISGYRNTPGRTTDAHSAIAQAVAQHPDRLIGYARINPWYGDASIQAFEHAIIHMGLRGLKLHPATYMLYPFDALTVRLVRRAGELGVPVLLHSGDENMCLPYQIDRMVTQCPGTTVILAHIGGYYAYEAALEVAERRSNVLVDTSEMPFPDRVRRAVDRLGANKVLFGTDAPCCDARLELLKIELAGLSSHESQRVLGENFAELVGIKKKRGDDADH
jgi:predicted TIM-barrel fold metal-dependent hydrolase